MYNNLEQIKQHCTYDSLCHFKMSYEDVDNEREDGQPSFI
jgi:hypothetical protein